MRNALSCLRSTILGVRTTWAVVGLTLIVLGLSEGGLRIVFWLKDVQSAPAIPDRRVLEQGYHNEAWAGDHFRELAKLEDRWQPFVYFRQKPFSGKTIHVDSEGRRATWTPKGQVPSPPEPKPIKITFLGGSSLWGFGARDDHTIPSYVAKELARRGVNAEIRNLAEIGYVNSQELIALIAELQAGERPDYVVFHDGVNDTTSALLEGTAGVTTNEINRQREFNILHSPGRLIGNFAAHFIKESALLRLARSIRRRIGSGSSTAYPNPSADASAPGSITATSAGRTRPTRTCSSTSAPRTDTTPSASAGCSSPSPSPAACKPCAPTASSTKPPPQEATPDGSATFSASPSNTPPATPPSCGNRPFLAAKRDPLD